MGGPRGLLSLLCGVSMALAAAPVRAPRKARAPEPRAVEWVMGEGAARALPKGAWRVEEGTAKVELEGNGARLRALRVGVARLRSDEREIRVVVARAGFELDGREAPRVFFAGRDRSGAFEGDTSLDAIVRFPWEYQGNVPMRIVSYDRAGAFVAERAVEGLGACGHAREYRCARLPRVRIVPEAVEVDDAGLGEVGIEARLGGRIAFAVGPDEVGSTPVCLPSEGPCGFEVALRPVLVRAWRGGPTVFKGAAEGEEAAFRERLARTLRPWETCGIRASVGPVRVVDPPRDVLVAFGLPFGLPSDGREEIEVSVGKRTSVIVVPPQLAPTAAAEYVARALEALRVPVQRISRPWLVHEERPAAELRVPVGLDRDVALTVRRPGRLAIGLTRVELRDGLDHFDDARSSTGAQEERALLLPLVDGSDATVEVVAVPFFGDGRRVGESFVAVDDPALVNVMVVDRGGLAASRTSHVLAHELGHILLRSGDHPDEGSRDAPRLLMDSDASDASRFGPRLITTSECERARKQGSSDPHRTLVPFAR